MVTVLAFNFVEVPFSDDCVVGLLSSHRRGAGGCGLPGTRAQASGTRTPEAAGSLSERAENGGEARQGLGNCSAGRGVLGVPWGRGAVSLAGRGWKEITSPWFSDWSTRCNRP